MDFDFSKGLNLEEEMEDEFLPPAEGLSPLIEEMQGISPYHRNCEEEGKKRGRRPADAFGERRQPYDWELKGCETIEDPDAKEKYRKELEKKEKQREYQRNYYARNKERLDAKNKEARKKREAKKAKSKQEKLTFEDVVKELGGMDAVVKAEFVSEETENTTTDSENTTTEMENTTTDAENTTTAEQDDFDTSLARLRRLREEFGATDEPSITEEPVRDSEEESEEQEEQFLTAEMLLEANRKLSEYGKVYHPVDYAAAYAMAEELAEMAERRMESQMMEKEKQERNYDISQQGILDGYREMFAEKRKEAYVLQLNPSKAESLRVFIEGHLFRDIREDEEIDNMEWLADMCEIWRELERMQIFGKEDEDGDEVQGDHEAEGEAGGCGDPI